MQKITKKYAKSKLEHKYDFVDVEARNMFLSKKVTPSMIKCAHGHNHCGLRDALINNDMGKA